MKDIGLFLPQYIGHARHQGPYPENSYPLYEYMMRELHYHIVEVDVVFTADGCPVLHHGVLANVYCDGRAEEVDISQTVFYDLKKYTLQPKSQIHIPKLEEIVKLASKENVWIMLDLTFQKYSYNQLKCLYDIIRKHQMKRSTIWGDANIIKLFFIDRNLICQVGGSWGRIMLIECVIKSLFCKQVIMSFNYYGGKIENFSNIVKWGHYLGFIMKAATINDKDIAKRFKKIGTDLINTDILTNEYIS